MHKCSNCSLNRKGLCESPNNKKCNSFLPAKANCRWCEYAETCQSLDRKTGILYVCTNFSKRETALPLHSFSDYDEYKRIHGIEDSNKKNKNKVSSKKKEVKKVKEDKEESDDYDFIIPTPKYDNPLPLKKKPIPKKSLYENDLLEEYPEKRNLWSPADIIDDIVSSEFDPRLFELVNDKDIPRPNNAIEFLTGPNFLSIDLFPRQWQIALEYFNAYCPYCSDTNFVRNKIVVDTPVEEIQDRVVLYNNAVCPKCGRNRYDAVNDGMHKPYEHFVGCVGQRAGKSKTAGMFSATILQQYLSLPNPVGFYRLGNDILKGTFVGIRFQDAVDNLWRPFESIVRASPWFKVYHDFLDAEGIRLGEELYKIRDSFIVYTYKSIACEAAGPDKRKLRGRCIRGNMLVSNSNGLVKASNKELLVDSNILTKDNNIVKIVGHKKQPIKKNVIRSILDNGITLDVTNDHRIPVFMDKKFSLRENRFILGKYVAVQVNGLFPSALKLDFNSDVCKPKYLKAIELISDGRVFTFYDIAKEFKVHVNTVRSYFFAGLLKNNCLDRFRHRDEKGYESICKYRINSNFNLEDWNTSLEGKINNRRNKICFPTEMTPELGRLIGYLIPDGWINGEQTFSFHTTSKDKVRDFCNTFKKVFNIKPRVRLDPRANKYIHNKCFIVEFSYSSIISYFKYLGLFGKVASTKSIPWCILQAPRKAVLECVSSMISSDGGIVARSEFTGIYYATSSAKLAREVQQLLLRLGYYNKISKKNNKYLVKITRYDSFRFLKEYTGLNKRDWKDDIKLTLSSKKRSYSKYLIPNTQVYVRSELNRMFEVKVPSYLKRYIDKNLMFSQVVKQKILGLKPVYDLEVDSEDHLFTANGVFVHNTRFIASIDEIGWFSGKEGNLTLDADEVYTALDNSLLTVRSAFSKVFPANPHAPTAHGIWISSPSSKLDKIMRLYKQSVNSDNMYGIKCPTWEFNPNITKAALRNKYAENPVNAERDFGANPPFSDAPFIRSPADLIDLISKRSNVLHVERYRVTKDSLGVNLRYPAIATKPHEIPCCLAVDAGYNNNSFALSLCHWLMKEEETEDENGNTVLEKVRKPAVSGLLEIQPANGMPLSFPKIYENVILRIIEEFNVKLVAFDRWQSIDLRQRVFADTGVDAVQYSVNMADFDTVRGYIYSGDLILPKLDGSIDDIVSLEKDIATLTTGNPVTAFILQCLLSKDTGRIITKGEEISDDILRSSVLGLTLLDHPDFEDLFLTDATDLGNFTGLAGIGIGNTMGTLSASSGGVNSCSGLGCSLSIGR